VVKMDKNLKNKARAHSIRSFVRGIIDGTVKSPDNAVIFHITDEMMFEAVTRKRLELIKVIKKRMPKSIVELAKLVNRTKQAVDRDLKILEKNDLVTLQKNGKIVTPLVEKEAVVFSFSGAKQVEV